MADRFASIAAGEIGSSRAPLVHPKPVPKNGKKFPLSKAEGSPDKVYKKTNTKQELDKIIDKLKEKYAPFLEKRSPSPENDRKKTELSVFDFRMATDADRRDFASVLLGDGRWEKITVPHYDGPVGYAVSYYRTEFTSHLPEGRALFLHFQCSKRRF